MRLDRTITVVGAHAEGEVGRVITGGVLAPPAGSMFERMQTIERDMPWLRDMLLFDPRGSVNAAVNLITPPIDPTADFGMIVMESDYFVPMSGSNLICTVTVALDTGIIEMSEGINTVRVDTPAGLVEVDADCANGKCRSVTFRNVPSFVLHDNARIDVPELGPLWVDVAYGGMIYVLVKIDDVPVSLRSEDARRLVELGENIKSAAAMQLPSIHPRNPEIHTINQTAFVGPVETTDGMRVSKNAVVVSPGRLDRCPCGTGTSARMAVMHAHGELSVGELFQHTSILDTQFRCRIVETTSVGTHPAIVPEITGRAWITGISQYGVDPDDPFPSGYRLGDTWFR
ncbi:MAG: proline racemase family protein [Roseitalea sp.]|jgi:proline racemase|nr:proline racemase family protein [Roseitalea sp.]MBO6722672.1 proline racemase family protein [Roseitalea sp.]MBO6741544.1 proline racemase family protein [Roseitalea sp.]